MQIPIEIWIQTRYSEDREEEPKYASRVYCRASLIHAISFHHDRWYGGGMLTIP